MVNFPFPDEIIQEYKFATVNTEMRYTIAGKIINIHTLADLSGLLRLSPVNLTFKFQKSD
jgi:hypothetical protein